MSELANDFTWDREVISEEILAPLPTGATPKVINPTNDEHSKHVEGREVLHEEIITPPQNSKDAAKAKKEDADTVGDGSANTDDKAADKPKGRAPEKAAPAAAEEEAPQQQVEEDSDDTLYSALYKDLRDEGIIKHINEDDDGTMTRERFFELQRVEYEKALDARLDAIEKLLGTDGRAFIEYKRNGGSTSDFFKFLNSMNVPLDGDINDDLYQNDIIRHRLAAREWTAEEIDNRIEYLDSSGKKAEVARQYLDELTKDRQQREQRMLDDIKREREVEAQERLDFRNNLAKHIETLTEVSGIPFKRGEKGKIVDFLTQDAYELEDGTRITSFRKKLHDVFQDPNKSILLAKLLMTDFDFSGLHRTAQTEVARQVRGHLENRRGLLRRDRGTSTLADVL